MGICSVLLVEIVWLQKLNVILVVFVVVKILVCMLIITLVVLVSSGSVYYYYIGGTYDYQFKVILAITLVIYLSVNFKCTKYYVGGIRDCNV